jgi:hypothetical protein
LFTGTVLITSILPFHCLCSSNDFLTISNADHSIKTD